MAALRSVTAIELEFTVCWLQGTAEQLTEGNEDFYIHALLLLFFASQNRPLVATR